MNKTPNVRFGGFAYPWEQRKFGEMVQTRRGLTYKPSDVQTDGVRVLRSSNIDEDCFIYGDDDVFVNPNAVNIETVKENDILITSANGSSRLVGKHALIKGISDYKAVHGGFMLLARTSNYNFINASMSSSWYTKFINIYVSGGNGAIGNLNKNDLDNQFIMIPSGEEQSKIGTYFDNLDQLITLHQRKHDALVTAKKTMAQKMFPKDGESVPEVRFAGFDGEWEEKKIFDCLYFDRKILTISESLQTKILNFKHVSASELKSMETEGGNIKLLSSGIYDGFTDETIANGKVNFGEVMALPSGGNAILKYYNGKFVDSGNILASARDEYCLEYIYYWSTYNIVKFENCYRGASIKHPDMKEISNISISLPSLEEQQKIGSFFKSLDDQIESQKRKIAKLQNTKKCLLEQMFI